MMNQHNIHYNNSEEASDAVKIILDSSCQTLSFEFYNNNPHYLKLKEARRKEQKIYVHLLALKDFCKHFSIGSIHCFFSRHPFPFSDDPGAVLKAISIHPGSIYYAHKDLKFDEAFVIKAVKANFKVLEYAPKRFRTVPTLVDLVEKERKLEKSHLINQFRRIIESQVSSPPFTTSVRPIYGLNATLTASNNTDTVVTLKTKRKSSSDPTLALQLNMTKRKKLNGHSVCH